MKTMMFVNLLVVLMNTLCEGDTMGRDIVYVLTAEVPEGSIPFEQATDEQLAHNIREIRDKHTGQVVRRINPADFHAMRRVENQIERKRRKILKSFAR